MVKATPVKFENGTLVRNSIDCRHHHGTDGLAAIRDRDRVGEHESEHPMGPVLEMAPLMSVWKLVSEGDRIVDGVKLKSRAINKNLGNRSTNDGDQLQQ